MRASNSYPFEDLFVFCWFFFILLYKLQKKKNITVLIDHLNYYIFKLDQMCLLAKKTKFT